jgi:hypothetical protein
MVIIALAASVSTQFEYLLRFGAMALAALTLLGALSDMQRAARNASGMPREDLLKLWFGGKLREQHTWEALTTRVSETARALRLAPPQPSARPSLMPRLRLLGIEALSEAIVIAAIALNWFLPAPATSSGEQIALLILGLLALGLLWFDWRLTRRFVAAVHAEIARLSPQASTSATSSS